MKITEQKPISRFELPALVGTPYYAPAARQVREKLLKCYDIHRLNLFNGEETANPGEHEKCVAWRLRLLDLDIDAFMNIPDGVYNHFRHYDVGGKKT